MKVVVTGANGFVGSHVVARLAADGHSIVAAARRPLTLPPCADWRESPALGSEADWSAVLAGTDAVVHAAARVHVMRERAASPLTEFRKSNVEGTLALARQAATAGVRRFIFLSSVKVYGETTTGRPPFNPAEHPCPVDPYGISKWEAEQGLHAIAERSNMECSAIRPVLIYGAGVKGNLATLARLATCGLPLPLGCISNRRSVVGVDNLADLVARAVAFPGALPAVMLVRDDESPSTSELLVRLAGAADRRVRLAPAPCRLIEQIARLLGQNAVVDRLFGSLEVDDAATRLALNWSPPLTLSEGLSRMMAR